MNKYSPTVSALYANDQTWWEKNGGGDQPDGTWNEYDRDGFDSYGYNAEGKDRDGKTEHDYAEEELIELELREFLDEEGGF